MKSIGGSVSNLLFTVERYINQLSNKNKVLSIKILKLCVFLLPFYLLELILSINGFIYKKQNSVEIPDLALLPFKKCFQKFEI